MSKKGRTLKRCELSEVKPFRLGPSREGLVVSGSLFDVTRVALSAGFGYHTAITHPLWTAYIKDPGPIAGDTPDERLWTLLHTLWVTQRNEAPESNEVVYDFGGDVAVRSVSMPTRVITVLLAEEEIPFVTPCMKEVGAGKTDVPSDVLAAMRTIVDYLWHDEEKHFRESDADCRKQHVFNSLIIVRNWLNDDTQ